MYEYHQGQHLASVEQLKVILFGSIPKDLISEKELDALGASNVIQVGCPSGQELPGVTRMQTLYDFLAVNVPVAVDLMWALDFLKSEITKWMN